jgi:hypothetical protein
MYILESYDWFGPIKDLEEVEKKIKEHLKGIDGVEFLGRFSPENKNFHWTNFYKAKDFKTWANVDFGWYDHTRDYKVHTHSVREYYV